jgi:hypothetical protein
VKLLQSLSPLLALALAACQMTVVNTGAGSAANTASPATSVPVTVPVQVGPGSLPGLPSLPGGLGGLGLPPITIPAPPVPIVVMPHPPVVVTPSPPVVVAPDVSPDPNFPAGTPPSLRTAPRFSSTALQHAMFAP